MEAGRLIEITDPGDARIAEFTSIRERDLTGRQGQFIAEGTVVLSMLAKAHGGSGPVRAEKLLLLKNRVAGLADLIDSNGRPAGTGYLEMTGYAQRLKI